MGVSLTSLKYPCDKLRPNIDVTLDNCFEKFFKISQLPLCSSIRALSVVWKFFWDSIKSCVSFVFSARSTDICSDKYLWPLGFVDFNLFELTVLTLEDDRSPASSSSTFKCPAKFAPSSMNEIIYKNQNS